MTPDLQSILASKLGTNIGHLWPILIEKAKFDAFIGIVIFSVLIIFSIIVFFFLLNKVNNCGWDENTYLPIILSVIVFIISSCILPYCISNARYPEVAAIQSLTNN